MVHICDYGCGQEATHQFKNGKWCCNKNVSLCQNIKNKIGNKIRGNILSEEHKKKLIMSNTGRKVSSKTRIKMILSHKKKVHPNLGKKHSEKTKQRMRNAALGEKNHNYWKKQYTDNNIPLYITYYNQLTIEEVPKRDIHDKNILTVLCNHCKKRFIPDINSVRNRARSLKGTSDGECRLYCSEECKIKCSVFNRSKYSKENTPNHSREVQPELRQMRLEIDNYTCQRCGKHQDELETGLHCHHIEGIRWEPLESADLDKVITLCKDCHDKVHKIEGCSYDDMKCKGSEV